MQSSLQIGEGGGKTMKRNDRLSRNRRGRALVWLIAGIAGILLVVLGIGLKQQKEQREGSERAKAAAVAIEAGARQAPTWPATPQALIEEFWKAASAKDYARLMVLCPGSVEADFKRNYDQWTPSPARSIGPPEAHPRAQGVQLYPVKVDFPGYPGKTIKMAVAKLDDGRLAIDGQNTIWW
jgi:type II secretory pathway pseudopilin PulG